MLLVPNNVFTPVATIVQVVPITVCEVDVPLVIVILAFCVANACAAAVSTPLPKNWEVTLTSEIVNEYPAGSNLVPFR